MIGLTESEIRTTLGGYPSLQLEGDRLTFANTEAKPIIIDLRLKEPHQLAYLARLLAHLGDEEMYFRGVHFWITVWGVWDPLVEAIGFRTLEHLRRSYGENRSIESAPAHYFRHNEFEESVCFLLQPMIVGWDAYFIPLNSDYFLEVSHDAFIDIHVRTTKFREEAIELLKRYKWIPYDGN